MQRKACKYLDYCTLFRKILLVRGNLCVCVCVACLVCPFKKNKCVTSTTDSIYPNTHTHTHVYWMTFVKHVIESDLYVMRRDKMECCCYMRFFFVCMQMSFILN